MTDAAHPGAGGGGPAPAGTRPVKVLLVDDQAIVGESIRRMLASEPDIQLHFCQDPSKAIETANTFAPTVILQDLVMPDIDGLLLVKFFRANPATRETPMVVLSSKEEPVIKAQAFGLGANDYLVKLPDRIELIARVRYHSRSYQTLLERNEAYRQLEASQRELAQEVAQAARYVQSLLPEKLTGPVAIDWRFVPSTQLGGDMFGYHWLDPDHLAIYLLDVSGHGVGSSLLAVSAANVLASQSLPSTDFHDPSQVLARLNDVFPMEKQYNKFFTIWYGVYCKSKQSLAYSTGGHPPALLYNAAQPGLQLKANNPVIGMLPSGIDFEARTVPVAPPARLLVFSDGVFEIELPSGSMWPFEEFVQVISRMQAEDGPFLDRFHAHVQHLHGSGILADDFSMLEARF